MANRAGARARRVAAAKEYVGASRSDNRRAGVLRDQEAAERPRRLVCPRQVRLDPERQAVAPERPIDGDRAQRSQRHAGPRDRSEFRVEVLDELEEHERAVLAQKSEAALAFAESRGA